MAKWAERWPYVLSHSLSGGTKMDDSILAKPVRRSTAFGVNQIDIQE